jgi:hypothetical protein
MRRLLSDPLPLRTTIDLGDYREPRYLPHVYGRVTLDPVPLDHSGREWLLADHAIRGVESVVMDDARTDGWQWVNRVDAAGHPIAILRTAQKPERSLAVTVAGKMQPTGVVIEHPADIVADLAAIDPGGWAIPELDQLRSDYPELRLGGMIDAPETLRAAIDAVLLPLGATWSAVPWLALRSVPGDMPAQLRLDDPTAEARHDGLMTAAIVYWGWDYASRRPIGAMRAEAASAIARHGRIEGVIDLRWVRSARDATRIAAQRLGDLARPHWSIQGALPMRGVLPELGDTVSVAHALMPSVAGLVREIELDRGTATARVRIDAPASPAPVVQVSRYASALNPDPPEMLQIVYRDGVATFTVLDDTGQPLAGAAVTLDGAETRITDRYGQVQFAAERGPHTLLIVAPGYAPYELEITL